MEAMKTVVLPDGKQVPALGMGTWMMGENPACRTREIAALQHDIDLGISRRRWPTRSNAPRSSGQACPHPS